MVAIVKLVGIIMVALGAIYIVKPAIMRQVVKFWTQEKCLYVSAAINTLIGIIFLIAASRCAAPWFVALMGIAGLLKGVLGFALGPKKINDFADKILNVQEKILRTLAIVILALGILLIYSA